MLENGELSISDLDEIGAIVRVDHAIPMTDDEATRPQRPRTKRPGQPYLSGHPLDD